MPPLQPVWRPVLILLYSALGVSGTAEVAAVLRSSWAEAGRGSMGRDGMLPPRSSNLPKIILPAVVCNTEVTDTSMFLPIILRALSTTTMVPSSR